MARSNGNLLIVAFFASLAVVHCSGSADTYGQGNYDRFLSRVKAERRHLLSKQESSLPETKTSLQSAGHTSHGRRSMLSQQQPGTKDAPSTDQPKNKLPPLKGRPDHPAVIATEGRVLLSVASQSQAVPADLIPCFAKWTARLIDLQATGPALSTANVSLTAPNLLTISFSMMGGAQITSVALKLQGLPTAKPVKQPLRLSNQGKSPRNASLSVSDTLDFQRDVAMLGNGSAKLEVTIKSGMNNSATQNLTGLVAASCSLSQESMVAPAASNASLQRLCTYSGFPEKFTVPKGLDPAPALLQHCSVAPQAAAVATALAFKATFPGYSPGSTICLPKGCSQALLTASAPKTTRSRALSAEEEDDGRESQEPEEAQNLAGRLLEEDDPTGTDNLEGPTDVDAGASEALRKLLERQSASAAPAPSPLGSSLLSSASDLGSAIYGSFAAAFISPGPASGASLKEVTMAGAAIELDPSGPGSKADPRTSPGNGVGAVNLATIQTSTYDHDAAVFQATSAKLALLDNNASAPVPAGIELSAAGIVSTEILPDTQNMPSQASKSKPACAANGFPKLFRVPPSCSGGVLTDQLIQRCDTSAAAVRYATNGTSSFEAFVPGTEVCLPSSCEPCKPLMEN